MPKQKKKRAVAASKAPYSTSKKTNSGDPPDTAESQNSESLYCGVCTTGVDYLIQCEGCDTWHCHTCAKVSEQLIELLVDCNEAHWFCHNCNPIAVEAICNFSEIHPSGAVSLETHKNAVESITTAIRLLDEVVLDTKKQLCKFAKTFQVESENEGPITDMADVSSDISGSNMTTNSDTTSEVITAFLNEEKERSKRRLNVIIHNVEESSAENGKARKEQDIQKVKSIFDEYMGIKPNITNALRIGKKGESGPNVKPRLLKVALATEHDKGLLLRNCTKLRSKNNPDNVRNVYVTPDLTPREQQQSKALRVKLTEMNKGAKKYWIKNGKIVQRVN